MFSLFLIVCCSQKEFSTDKAVSWEIIDTQIDNLGKMHNDLLVSLEGKISIKNVVTQEDFDMFERTITRKFKELGYNELSDKEFGYKYFRDNLNFFEFEDGLDYLELAKSNIQFQTGRIQAKMSDSEIKLTKEFFDLVFNGKRVDFSMFDKRIKSEVENRDIELLLLSSLKIFQYSSEYWSNKRTENLKCPFCPALIGVAVIDLGGAWAGAVDYILDNPDSGSNPEGGNEMLAAAGRAAVTTSSGFLGPLVDRIFD